VALLYVQLKRNILHSFEGSVHKVILLPTAHVQQVSSIANNSWCTACHIVTTILCTWGYIAAKNWCRASYIATNSRLTVG